MLRDRRNCFLGRCVGFDGLRIWPKTGWPKPFRLYEDCLYLGGGPIGCADGESADWGLPSLCGDASKHSSGLISPEGLVDIPLPNRKGGLSTCADF